MPTVRIPLVGSYNTRGIAGNAALTLNEDQRFLNCTFNLVQNPITQKATIYVEKRPGLGVDSLVASGSASTGLIKPQSFTAALTAFGETNSTIYFGTTSVGTITGRALHFTETLISNVAHVGIKSSDGTGWYYVAGAKDTLTYTGDTHTNTTIDGIASTAGMYVGQAISGTGIQAGTRIATVSGTSITTTLATTATNAGITITKEPIAKIIDADFVTTGTYISAFVPLDGYLFYADDSGYVNNSDLNSVTAYTSGARIAVQQSPDPTIGVAVQKNTLVAFGLNSNEKFQNAGFTTAPLQPLKTQIEHIGALDQRSITSIEDDIYYVSTPYEGDVGVQRMRGLQSTRVSTANVDRIIGTVSSTNGAIYAGSFRLGGYPYATFFLSLASDGPSSKLLLESGDYLLLESGDKLLLEDTSAQVASFSRLMVYNTQLNIWSEWDCDEATFFDSIGSGTANQILATSRVNTSGKIYKIDPTSDGQLYQDDGSAYSMQIRTSRSDLGTSKRKFVEEIRLVTDKVSAGTATLEASDDDFQSWWTVGTFDLTQQEPKIMRGGSHKGGRAYRITHSYNGPFRAEALEIKYSEANW